jgi:hypothetical protein
MRIRSVTGLVCAVLLLTLVGCAGNTGQPPVELVPVEGTITLDGQPLAGASVMFGGGAAMGETDDNGHYVLGQGEKKGCPVGEYQVIIEKWVMPDGSLYKSADMSPMDAGAKQEIPAKYSNMESTELKASVSAGGGTIDFELTSSGK